MSKGVLVWLLTSHFALSITLSSHAFTIDQQQLLVDFKVLSSDEFAGRKVFSRGNHQAQAYIIEQLTQASIMPYQGHFAHRFDVKDKQATNIIAVIPSKDTNAKHIVLSAHYDHIGAKGRRVFNGADDNASGVSALLSIGKALKQYTLNYHVILLFTDAEESNLKGAKAFIEQNTGLADDILININLDMLAGTTRSNRLYYLHGNLSRIFTDQQITQLLERYQNSELKVASFRRFRTSEKRIKWLKASDHYEFYRHDIPIIYYGVGTHKNYHTVDDEYQNTNHQLLLKTTDLILGQILFINQIKLTK